ncbi:MAG: DUF1273 domain-containing protein [Ruminococcaceae bacterium]|nr:DUF1273 domain-containing protein [Oscillospiraceae bacterium]
MKDKTVCFTGHRAVPRDEIPQLNSALYSAVAKLICRGYTDFLCGGAVGFDTMAAECIINLRRRFPDITLSLVLPCRDQTMKWKNSEDVSQYKRILGSADRIEYISDFYNEECMHERNRRMVDRSSVCISYLKHRRGGTHYTYKYAKQKGLEILNLSETTLPDLFQLSICDKEDVNS